MMPDNADRRLGIYVHVPFCLKKCAYCDFYSLPRLSDDAVNTYISALKGHFEMFEDALNGYTVDTVFFGGGTPSLLSVSQMADICDALGRRFRISADAEITSEANPATFDAEKLRGYRACGINRLSIGAQSANDDELKLLGRMHTSEQIKTAFDAAISAGFDNISLDLMYGIPSQTLRSFQKTLELVKHLSPKHLSVYGLQLEEGTPLCRGRDGYSFPDEDTEVALDRLALELLTDAGYRRYEISNYALPGYECKHNLKYWHGEEYIGFGAAAHSYLFGMRYSAPKDIEAYEDAVNSRDTDALRSEPSYIGADERAEEYVMLRMRLAEGVSASGFESATGMPFSPYAERLESFVRSGHVKRCGDVYSFTPKGYDVSNYILSSVI